MVAIYLPIFSSGSCHDINECTSKQLCPEIGQVCTNNIGSFKCDCKTGYNMTKSGSCEDIDECETNSHMCLIESETCQNTHGSYTCDCAAGYRRLGDYCDDINECYVNPCTNSNHQCKNNIGSYDCICKAGWQSVANTTICDDVNECLDENICTKDRVSART